MLQGPDTSAAVSDLELAVDRPADMTFQNVNAISYGFLSFQSYHNGSNRLPPTIAFIFVIRKSAKLLQL